MEVSSFLIFAILCCSSILTINGLDDKTMHPKIKLRDGRNARLGPEENTAHYWQQQAAKTVEELANRKINTNIAKNVILFLGDGMSVPTLAASRVYMGGEKNQLAFDKFPHTAVSKTYCVDMQVADSACSATAYLTGVKGNYGTIGVTGDVARGDCEAMANTTTHVPSIAYWSQQAGKATGLVTTARVTHASPAGVYASTADRDWESDKNLKDGGGDNAVCTDIGKQLVLGETGRRLNVVMGGGRHKLLPDGVDDDEGHDGGRGDGLNLIQMWQDNKRADNLTAQYVWNRDQLLNLDDRVDNLLGLFESDHCNYHLEADPVLDPSLAEMTEAAIKILSKNENGYFLFVEGARIDMAHHESKGWKAVDETAEFSKAIDLAASITSEEDTLIVVTSDHAHTMSFSGYSGRGNDILGLNNGVSDVDDMVYTTINYANGPGYDERHNLKHDKFDDVDYQYPSVFPMKSETHGGDDVLIFARGPHAHLYGGVIEQNVIPAVMKYASCVGEGPTACDQK